MEFEWDDGKNKTNKRDHKIGFEAIFDFDWTSAQIADRSRVVDSEQRFAAIGPMRGKLYTVIYTWRKNTIRIISLRRSNRKEERAYEQKT